MEKEGKWKQCLLDRPFTLQMLNKNCDSRGDTCLYAIFHPSPFLFALFVRGIG